jgi:DNA-3-methyladenine glycosylase II
MQASTSSKPGILPRPLNRRSLARAANSVGGNDPDLRRIRDTLGVPPLWDRQPGFATLVFIILEQQVSLASARAAFERLTAARSPLTPGSFLELDADTLKQIGFSRQKTRYARALATSIVDGTLDLDALHALEDDCVREELTKLPGIGPWTADIYMVMALLRPDVWPRGDLALAKAVQAVKGLKALPSAEEQERLAQRWKPWRAVAARLFWSHYLHHGL